MDIEQLEKALQTASAAGVLILYHMYHNDMTVTDFAKEAGIQVGTVWRYVYEGREPRGVRKDKVIAVVGEIDVKMMQAIYNPAALAAEYARNFMVGYLGECWPDALPLTSDGSAEAEAPTEGPDAGRTMLY